MVGTNVSTEAAHIVSREQASLVEPRRHRVRELVCSYRPVRDSEGRIISVHSLALSTPRVAAQVIAPLIADQPVEMFAVACLSARSRLLAWHVVSRGTRSSTQISIPDVFVPACVTPGTVSILVAHNHPSGDPTPSPDDVALTTRLASAATVFGLRAPRSPDRGRGAEVFQFP